MSVRKRQFEQPSEISKEELESERATELPDREALSVVGADVAIPLDPSVAADVLAGEEPPAPEPEE
jgi:hypothetical protein